VELTNNIKNDVETKTNQLASIESFEIETEKANILVLARVHSTPVSVEAGKYIVHFGTKKLSLKIDVEDGEATGHYSSFVDASYWKQESKDNSTNTSHLDVSGKMNLNVTRGDSFIGGDVKKGSSLKNAQQENISSKKIYPLVTYAANKWSIGHAAGDPSKANSVKPKGMENALYGAYINGGDWEKAEGYGIKKQIPLCLIQPNNTLGKNNKGVTLTLICDKHDLIVSSEPNSQFADTHANNVFGKLAKLNPFTESDEAKTKRELKDIFAQFCIERAKNDPHINHDDPKKRLTSTELVLDVKNKQYGGGK
jgi:hypothetical protein